LDHGARQGLFGDIRPVRFTGTALDITDRKEAEDHLRILVNELSHRVKNTLAVIQSITDQTFKTGTEVNGIRLALAGRLQALAETHTLLTLSKWESVDLATLAERAVGHLARNGDARFSVVGPRVQLTSKASLSLGLVIHELSTNAAKYGAWAVSDGVVTVKWHVTKTDVVLEWTETGRTDVMAPGRTSFGTKLIDQVIDYDLGGEVVRHYRPSGLSCTITVPIDNTLTGP